MWKLIFSSKRSIWPACFLNEFGCCGAEVVAEECLRAAPLCGIMPQTLVGLSVTLFGHAVFTPAPLEHHASVVALNMGLTWHRDTKHATSA